MIHDKNTRKEFVVLATRLEKSVLAELKGIAEGESCPISILVRKAIDVLGETYQKELVPASLTERVPTLKDPVGITVRVDRLVAQRVKKLSKDRNQSVSDLLRIAIHYFILLYQGPEYRSSMTEFVEIPSEQIRVTTEIDKEVMEELTRVAEERNEPLHVVINDAFRLYAAFYGAKTLAQGMDAIRGFMNFVSIVAPQPKKPPLEQQPLEQPPLEQRQRKTILSRLEEVRQEVLSETQNKTGQKHSRKVSDSRETK